MTTRKNGRNTAARTKAGRFEKGNAGRPKGARNKASLAVEALMQGEAEALSRRAVDMALEGDGAALKLCLDRIAPVRREPPSPFTLPDIGDVGDLPKAVTAVMGAVAAGELSAGEGKALTAMIDDARRSYETADLLRRIERLEADTS